MTLQGIRASIDGIWSRGAGRRQGTDASAERPRQFLHSLVAGTCGFLLGAVFWHWIGFWGFVTSTVLRGPMDDRPRAGIEAAQPLPRDQRASITPARPAQAGRKHGPATAAAAVPPDVRLASCVALVLDRTAGTTTPSPCQGDLGAFGPGTGLGRSDRLRGSADGPMQSLPWRVTIIDGDPASGRDDR